MPRDDDYLRRPDPQARERWLAILEELGPARIRERLGRIDHSSDAPLSSIGDHAPYPSRSFVETWLKRRNELPRFSKKGDFELCGAGRSLPELRGRLLP